jgi:hypothetical protein
VQDRSRIRRAAWKQLVGAGLTLLGVVWIAAGSVSFWSSSDRDGPAPRRRRTNGDLRRDRDTDAPA